MFQVLRRELQYSFDQSATAGLNIGENIYQDATADGGGDAAVSDLGNVNDAAPTDGGTGGNNNLGNIHE